MYREYLNGLQEHSCKSLGRGAAVIKVGDVIVIGEDVVPRHRWRLGIVVELIKNNDGLVRGAKVKVSKTRNVIPRPVNCLYPTEVRATEQLHCNIRNVKKTKKKDVDRNTIVNLQQTTGYLNRHLFERPTYSNRFSFLVDIP